MARGMQNDPYFWDKVEDWFESELRQYDPTQDEATTLRFEFHNREKGKWTIGTWAEHMQERIRQLRMGF